MKKIIMTALMAAVLNTANAENCASNFTGFYSGVQVGANSGKVKLTIDNNNGTEADKASKTKTAFLGGLFAGYGAGIGSCWYIGGELYLNLASLKVNLADKLGYENVSVTYKSNYNYGAKLRVGYTFTPQVLVFLGLGAELASTKLTYSENGRDNDSYSKSKKLLSFAPSIGADFLVSKNIFVRAEASYLIGKQQKFNLSDDQTADIKAKTKQARFVVGVGYKF